MNAFDFAIQMERDGCAWYRRGAKTVKDSGARRMLESLADDETRHEEMVTRLKTDRGDLPEGQPLAGVRNVFQELVDVGRSFFDENDELRSVLKKSIDIEEQSVRLYGELAEKAPDPAHKHIWESLRAEERQHEQLLTLALEYMDQPELVLENAEFLFYGYDEAP